MMKLLTILAILLLATSASAILDIPEDRLPPTGDFYEWQKVDIVNALDITYLSLERVPAWVMVPRLSIWERFNKLITVIVGIVPTLLAVLAFLKGRRR